MKIRGYTFETTVFNNRLATSLGCVSDEFLVVGEYSIDWDGDIPIVVIDGVAVYDSEDNEVGCDEFITLYTDEWADDIANSGNDSEWAADYQASIADMYMDMYKDGTYE